MALHRDIYWVGSQWAVTGYGIQACDQKQKGRFDIEACRIWQDGVLEGMRALTWLNIEDFDRAIEIARLHYPEPPRKVPRSEERVVGLIETMLKEVGRKAESQKAESQEATSSKESPIEPQIPAVPTFEMRIESWPAKFVPQWRIRMKR
ncbi:MAG: hypothetical protein NVS4B4_08050 [Bradyrhizobium sp.]